MTANQRCVLVYNPISGHGHLDSWNAMFVSLLLEKGWRVLSLTPDVSALRSGLAQLGIAESPSLQVLSWNTPTWLFSKVGLLALLRQTKINWYEFASEYFYRRPGSATTPDMPFLAYWRQRSLQLIVPTLFRISRSVHAHVLHPLRYRRTGRHEAHASGSEGNDLDVMYLDPMEFACRVKAALRRAEWKPGLVFNMYMDMYRSDADSWARFSRANDIPWAGIRFAPAEAPGESYYGFRDFLGMCFLYEQVCQDYQEKRATKCFQCLPDATIATLPEQPSDLAVEIRRRAAGRKIVFLGGSIGFQKNLANWYEVIALADPRKWFFVQIGELHKGTFTTEDLVAHECFMAAPPENCFVKNEYLPDESLFNEIIALSDVIFAVYRNFQKSSNMLSKAASFRKPILVSDAYVMGERVNRYKIGLGVPENSPIDILNGLVSVAEARISDENFAHFRTDFGAQVIADRLNVFLEDCLSKADVCVSETQA